MILAFIRRLCWRIADWVHRDKSLPLVDDKGDPQHMSTSWIQEKKRDASW